MTHFECCKPSYGSDAGAWWDGGASIRRKEIGGGGGGGGGGQDDSRDGGEHDSKLLKLAHKLHMNTGKFRASSHANSYRSIGIECFC